MNCADSRDQESLLASIKEISRNTVKMRQLLSRIDICASVLDCQSDLEFSCCVDAINELWAWTVGKRPSTQSQVCIAVLMSLWRV